MTKTWKNKNRSVTTRINDVDRDDLEKFIRDYIEKHETFKARTIGLAYPVHPTGVNRVFKKLLEEGLIEIYQKNERAITYRKTQS